MIKKLSFLLLLICFFTQPLFAKDFLVTTFTDKDDSSCDEADEADLTKDCSLREAIKAANAETDSEDDTIQLAGDGTKAYEITSGQLYLTAKNLMIQGLGPDFSIIDADPDGTGATSRILTVGSTGDNLALSGITFKNGKFTSTTSPNGGGAIFLQSKDYLTIENCSFENNESTYASGGAIDAWVYDEAKMTITNSAFTGNTADDYGGAIAIGNNASLNITGSRFMGNKSTYSDGGAIYIEKNGSITVSQSYFYGNQALTGGGVAYVTSGTSANTTSFTENIFEENESPVGGGALMLVRRDGVDVQKNVFRKNSTQSVGGALVLYSTKNLSLQNNIFSENQITGTSDGGAAIYILSGSGLIDHNTFYGNDAGSQAGGAIYIYSAITTSIALKGNIFSTNTASSGSNCYGNIYTNGYNFFDEYADCTLTKVDVSSADDFLDTDAKLSEIKTQEVGGLTFYYYDFQEESPAKDVVSSCPSEDIFSTPRTDPCDAGAFEAVVTGTDSSSSSDTSGDSTSDGGSSSTGESSGGESSTTGTETSGGDTTTGAESTGGTETTSGSETTGGDSGSTSSGETSTTGSDTSSDSTTGDSSTTGEGTGSTENGTTGGTTESSTTAEEGSSSASTSSDGSSSSAGSDTSSSSDGSSTTTGGTDAGNPNEPTPPPADGNAAEGSGGCSLRI